MPLFLIVFTNIIDGFTSYGKCGETGTTISSTGNSTAMNGSTVSINTTTATLPSLTSLTNTMKNQAIWLISDWFILLKIF